MLTSPTTTPPQVTPISHVDDIEYFPEFFSQAECNDLFPALQSSLKWSEEFIIIFGKQVKVPRLVCWYGDNNIAYKYSGVKHIGLPWTTELLEIKQRIEKQAGHGFNSVLGNFYRNESDSMGWHSDNEKELGKTPCIASISLGEERLFKIRHIRSRKIINLMLTNGSLLIMKGNFQNEWQHCIPKVKLRKTPRINLTFRHIFAR